MGRPRQLPHKALLLVGAVLILGIVSATVLVWRSPDLDLRCDESRKREVAEQGREYSCVLQIRITPTRDTRRGRDRTGLGSGESGKASERNPL
jgi:hypothetical protein